MAAPELTDITPDDLRPRLTELWERRFANRQWKMLVGLVIDWTAKHGERPRRRRAPAASPNPVSIFSARRPERT